jgi:hypothetical protein
MVVGTSSYALVAQRSGQTNVAQYLSGYLRTGNYTLTIEQPAVPLFQGSGATRCYPFVWDILLRSADVTNIVDNVEPASAVQLSPAQELNILITFSQEPYSGGKIITPYV